jgi:hypothetical protein
MRRKWNWALWVGFIVIVAALFSVELFAQFPITRDFPWANLLLFAIGGTLLVIGLVRAFGQPAVYRGKIAGSILMLISLAGFGLFCYGLFYIARQLPASTEAPHIGAKAPDFSLPDQDGKTVALRELLNSTNTRAVVLIFYRGYW